LTTHDIIGIDTLSGIIIFATAGISIVIVTNDDLADAVNVVFVLFELDDFC
jgi:hypothetical protein